MMRYFFHTVEDGNRTSDDDGVELADDEAAKFQAAQFLADVAGDVISDDRARKFGIEVLNESGALITAIGFTLDDGSGQGLGEATRGD